MSYVNVLPVFSWRDWRKPWKSSDISGLA